MLYSLLGASMHMSHEHQKLDTSSDFVTYGSDRSRLLTTQASNLGREEHIWDVPTYTHKLAWGWRGT